MIRNIFIAALAGTAAIATPALAKPGADGPANVGANAHVGANANVGAGMNARVNSQGSINASPNARANSSVNSAVNANTNVNSTTNATKSQGLQHASPTGIANASPKSVLARGAVQPTALPGLTTGLTVQNSTGATVGTVSQVVTDTSGNIRLVVVTTDSGQTLRLAPSTLTISGGVVTTTGG